MLIELDFRENVITLRNSLLTPAIVTPMVSRGSIEEASIIRFLFSKINT